jgi:dipeptidyl aminopeptidase/acylaminoacyl peptidase
MSLTLPLLKRQRESVRSACLLFLTVNLFGIHLQCQEKPFTVKDDIAMVRFNDPSADTNSAEVDSERFSPDGKHVAIVTTKGVLLSDKTESSITIFDVEDIRRLLDGVSKQPPKPRVVATISAISHGEVTIAFAPVIKDLRWSRNSTHLYFRGESSLGGFQVYEASVGGTSCRSLTEVGYDVDRFDVEGNILAYSAARVGSPPMPVGRTINRDSLDATGAHLKDLLFPGQLAEFAAKQISLYTLRIGEHPGIPRRVPEYSVRDISLLLYFLPFDLSPDGTQLISTEPVTGSFPASWSEYDPTPPFEHRRLQSNDPTLTASDNVLRLRRYTVIDLRTGRATPLVDAPNAEILGYFADVNEVAWSKDQRRVLVTNTFLPESSGTGQAPQPRRKPCAVADIDLSSLQYRCLYSYEEEQSWKLGHVSGIRFGADDDEAIIDLISDTKRSATVKFGLTDGTWKKLSVVPAIPWMPTTRKSGTPGTSLPSTIRVYVQQGLNAPPTLWVSDTHTSRLLWNPNPQLDHFQFGEASAYRWKDPTNREWLGGLVKPVGYVPGHRYPLVIQMYAFREHQFLTDGTDPTAFAARPLASAGFVVLQIRKQPNVLSDADAQTSLEGYESAVQSLDDAGLIDRTRVGVVGFSWTCWYAINALIKAPNLFAAATIADGLDNSYMEYLIAGPDASDFREQLDKIRGGSPFGQGLERWVKEAPGFHLDMVSTPVRIEAIGPMSILQEWELYASLSMQQKPVDLVYFPDGTHIHQRPLERLESQQGNVDWMRFWLQGYESPDPAKQAEYQLWRELRASRISPKSHAVAP